MKTYITMKIQQNWCRHNTACSLEYAFEISKVDCYLIVKITLYTKVQNKGKRQRKNKNQILQKRLVVLKNHDKIDVVK